MKGEDTKTGQRDGRRDNAEGSEKWRAVVREYCENPPAPLHYLDLAEIDKWHPPKQFTSRQQFPLLPPIHDTFYNFHLQASPDSETSQLLLKAGRDRLLRLLTCAHGNFFHAALRELVYLTDVKMLAHLALLYRIPRPLRCGGQQEFSNAFLRFCAIVGVDDEMVGWLRMLYIPDVFWSLKEGIRKSLEHPERCTRILFDRILVSEANEVTLAQHRLEQGVAQGEPSEVLDRLSQLVTHAQRARTDAILNWEESKERWAKQSEANEASRKARAVEKERKKQENLAREEERRRQKREENAAKAQGKTAEALVQREASTGKAKSSKSAGAHLPTTTLRALGSLTVKVSSVKFVTPAQSTAFETWLEATRALQAALQ